MGYEVVALADFIYSGILVISTVTVTVTVTTVVGHFPEIFFALAEFDDSGIIVNIIVSAVSIDDSDIVIAMVGFGEGGTIANAP